MERFNSDLAGRPTLIRGNRQLLFQGLGRLTESSLLNVKNKSHSISAQFKFPAGGASGVLVGIEIDIDAAAADQDHLISPGERLRIAMARQ